MIELNNEEMLTLKQAAHELPGRPNISTLHRWRLRGVHGVKLETLLVGGRRFTSREAVERFVAATTASASGERPLARTPKQRQRAVARAERELRIAGFDGGATESDSR